MLAQRYELENAEDTGILTPDVGVVGVRSPLFDEKPIIPSGKSLVCKKKDSLADFEVGLEEDDWLGMGEDEGIELTDIEDVSAAAFIASDVTVVKEEIIDGETDDGFGVSLWPQESMDSHPDTSVRNVPKSEGGTADRLVFPITRVGLGLP